MFGAVAAGIVGIDADAIDAGLIGCTFIAWIVVRGGVFTALGV